MTWQEKKKEVLGVAAGAARRVFSSPDGKAVLEAMELWEGDLIATDNEGRVDPNATLANVGAQRVIRFLRELSTEEFAP